MKLSISNIAWEPSESAEHLALIHRLGCDGVELAPSVLWPEPSEVTESEARRVASQIRDHGLEVVGFHALLYTRPDLQLFLDRPGLQRATDYLAQLARLCRWTGGGVLILGSPRNRVRHGKTTSDCMAWAADGLRTLAPALESSDVTLCLEPLGPDETEFLQSSDEAMALIRLVDHPRIALHLDVKAMVSAGESMAEVLSRHGRSVRHVHVGDPGLAPPGTTGVDHAPFGRALREFGYDRYVSIEMRRGSGPSREVVTRSLAYVREQYLGQPITSARMVAP